MDICFCQPGRTLLLGEGFGHFHGFCMYFFTKQQSVKHRKSGLCKKRRLQRHYQFLVFILGHSVRENAPSQILAGSQVGLDNDLYVRKPSVFQAELKRQRSRTASDAIPNNVNFQIHTPSEKNSFTKALLSHNFYLRNAILMLSYILGLTGSSVIITCNTKKMILL